MDYSTSANLSPLDALTNFAKPNLVKYGGVTRGVPPPSAQSPHLPDKGKGKAKAKAKPKKKAAPKKGNIRAKKEARSVGSPHPSAVYSEPLVISPAMSPASAPYPQYYGNYNNQYAYPQQQNAAMDGYPPNSEVCSYRRGGWVAGGVVHAYVVLLSNTLL